MCADRHWKLVYRWISAHITLLAEHPPISGSFLFFSIAITRIKRKKLSPVVQVVFGITKTIKTTQGSDCPAIMSVQIFCANMSAAHLSHIIYTLPPATLRKNMKEPYVWGNGKRKGENGKRSFVSMSSERQTKYGPSSYRLVREQRMLAKMKEQR